MKDMWTETDTKWVYEEIRGQMLWFVEDLNVEPTHVKLGRKSHRALICDMNYAATFTSEGAVATILGLEIEKGTRPWQITVYKKDCRK